MKDFIEFLVTHFYLNVWLLILLGIFILITIVLVKVSRSDDDLNLLDLLKDEETHKISSSKFRILITTIVVTWAFIYETMAGRLSEWLFFGYLAAFVTDRIMNRYISLKDNSDASTNIRRNKKLEDLTDPDG